MAKAPEVAAFPLTGQAFMPDPDPHATRATSIADQLSGSLGHHIALRNLVADLKRAIAGPAADYPAPGAQAQNPGIGLAGFADALDRQLARTVEQLLDRREAFEVLTEAIREAEREQDEVRPEATPRLNNPMSSAIDLDTDPDRWAEQRRPQ